MRWRRRLSGALHEVMNDPEVQRKLEGLHAGGEHPSAELSGGLRRDSPLQGPVTIMAGLLSFPVVIAGLHTARCRAMPFAGMCSGPRRIAS